jgi:hypothetical protein
MLIILVILALLGGVVAQLFSTYILKVKEPSISELWKELDQQSWFIELMDDPTLAMLIESYKDQGILRDPHYVQRLLSHQGTIDGFITHLKNKKRNAPTPS